jgi:multiple sugar transport system permease protein
MEIKRNPANQLNKNINKTLLNYLLIIICIVMAFPFIWMILSSLKPIGEIFLLPPRIFPILWRFENYPDLIKSFPFLKYLFNSFKVAILAVIGQLISCSLAAYAFARVKFPGRDTIFIFLLGTMMIPQIVLIIPQYKLYSALGLINTYFPLILPAYFGGAFGTFLLRQLFLTIPSELDDSAMMDGAGPLQIFYYIYLPLAKPALATLALFIFMGNWNDLLGPVIYLTDYHNMTLTVGLAYIENQYIVQWPLVLAGATISIIPIVIIYVFTQKYFVRSFVMTGIKG